MATKFDLEEKIMSCWCVCDDIGTIIESLDGMNLDPIAEDTLYNLLIGLKSMYNIKFENLFCMYEMLLKTKTFDGEQHGVFSTEVDT